ncbi:MAG: NAD(P)-dependent oxidoreductase [Thaumarchaeota archaeon]|nr:NAD(P)-dependent oxidoreductase [Nitrososphaerota archaeon]
MSDHTVAVVGGSGFIGSSIAARMAKKYRTIVVDQKRSNLARGVEFKACDIRNPKEVRQSLADVDLVIHTAIIQIPAINSEKRLGYDVNVLGTQNVCEAVEDNPGIRGLILAGTWHTIGESAIDGMVDEGFGYRPDKVEDRARLYAISKIVQESIVRYFDELSPKVFGIIRMGTVLGEEMPALTVANLFIQKGLKGQPITPYKHSMHRPMLYVDVNDVTKAFQRFSDMIVQGKILKDGNSLNHVVNVVYPKPITIRELAFVVRREVLRLTEGNTRPRVEVVDDGLHELFGPWEKSKFEADTKKANILLGLSTLVSPEESIRSIIKGRLRVR